MYQGAIGGYGSQFGGQMNNMGQQPVRNDRMGYAPGGMPQQNPNYGQMPAPAPRPMPMPYPVDSSRLLGGGMSQYPGFGGNVVQPGGMDFLRGQFGGGFTPMPDGGRVDNPYFGGGFNPQPDGGRVDNPDMQNPFRSFNNGNPFYNAKGNLRMRYRPGGQGYQGDNMTNFWQAAPQSY